MPTQSPTETRLVLIRHAEQIPVGRFAQHTCPGLSRRGRSQAQHLARRLAERDLLTPDVILASRAARAIETAATVASRLAQSVGEETCDLCEMHPGEAEGMTVEQMRQQYGPNYASVPGAEYFPDWLPRASAALQRIATTYEGKTIIGVTHNGVIKASFVTFGGMHPPTADLIQTANTGITEWVLALNREDPHHGVWSLRRHNDCAHLNV